MVAEQTRNAIWQELLDVARLVRYYEALSDQHRRSPAQGCRRCRAHRHCSNEWRRLSDNMEFPAYCQCHHAIPDRTGMPTGRL